MYSTNKVSPAVEYSGRKELAVNIDKYNRPAFTDETVSDSDENVEYNGHKCFRCCATTMSIFLVVTSNQHNNRFLPLPMPLQSRSIGQTRKERRFTSRKTLQERNTLLLKQRPLKS